MEIAYDAEHGLEPSYTRDGDAGMDLKADNNYTIPGLGHVLVGTSLALAMPSDVVALIHPRSGLALKHGITVLNTPGTIDSNYRGKIGVILYNTTTVPFEVHYGDRIAQLVFQKVIHPTLVPVEALDETERGSQGFGSSGIA
jgi:dUTP pyrophosphatase